MLLLGILLAAIASIFLLLARASQPNVAFLGRLPGAGRYADSARNPDVETLPGVIAFRPEASPLYINAETVLESFWQGSVRRRMSSWSSAASRPRPLSIS